jgi:hypothetical protein
MEIASSTIPQGFLYYAKRLQGFQRSKIKVFPIGTRANIPMGTITTVKFPTNSYIDLRSIRAGFTATARIGTGHVQFPRYTQSLMKTIHYIINGQKFCGTSVNEVNTLYNIFLKCKTGFDYNRSLIYSGWGDEKATSDAGHTDKDVSKWGSIDDFPLFSSDCQPQFFDTSMGELEIQIQWAGAEVLIGDNTNVNGMTYSIDNIEFEVDVLSFGSDILDMIVKRKLELGGEIRIPFYDVIEYTQINKGTNTFQINATSLDKILVCIRASDYNTVSKAGVSTGDTNSKFFKYSSMVDATDSSTDTTTIAEFIKDNHTWQFRINGKNYPEYGAVPLYKSYDHIVNCFGDISDCNTKNILNCISNAMPTYSQAVQYYSHNNFIFGIDLTPPSTSFEGSRTLAGLNTGGLSMPIDLILTNVRTDVYVTVFFICHKILKFSMGQGMVVEP